jgi:hypothetical protein
MSSNVTPVHTEAMPNNPLAALQAVKASARAALEAQSASVAAPEAPTVGTDVAAAVAAPVTQEETPVAEPAAEEDPYADPKFQQLLAKHREQRAEIEALNKQKAEFEAKKKYAELAERISKKDFKAIEEAGVSLDEWANHEYSKANGAEEAPKPEELYSKLQAEIQSLKAEREAEKQQQQEYYRQQQVNAFKNKIGEELKAKPEFSVLTKPEYQDKIYNKIRQHALDTQDLTGTPELLSVEKAARLVLDSEMRRLRAEIEAFKDVPGFKTVLAPAAPTKSSPQLQTLMPGELTDTPMSTSKELDHSERKQLIRQRLAAEG